MANLEFKRAINFMGFLSTMLIAMALLISLILSLFGIGGGASVFRITDVISAFTFFANVLAYFITIVAGFYYVKTKRNRLFMVLQVVGTIIILASVIYGAFLG